MLYSQMPLASNVLSENLCRKFLKILIQDDDLAFARSIDL